jgi:7-keto-8-aminopelargonate synthetase-like enzyme
MRCGCFRRSVDDLHLVNTKSARPTLLTGKRIEGPVSARIRIDGRPYINFFGWGYLALSIVPELRVAALETLQRGAAFVQQVPAAAGAVDPIFDDAERAAALVCGTEASVYFASGYLIGAVGMASLHGSYDLIMLDEHAHYSLVDGAKLAGVPVHTFNHCSTDSLVEALGKLAKSGERPLVATDGAFAVTGRVPPLHEYAAALMPHQGRLFVDEAHTFGVVGELGRGAAELCGIERFATTAATLSKAYCSPGAILGCSTETAMRLRTVPQIRGACAGSPLSASVAAASLRYVAGHPELRKELRVMADYMRMRLRRLGMDVIDSPAPIVAFRCGHRADMQALQQRLFERGIYIVHATSYVGCGPEGILRCAVFRDHTRDDVDALIGAIG